MKRFELNNQIIDKIASLERFQKYSNIIFIDTETTKSQQYTNKGLEWYDEIVSIQALILPAKFKILVLDKIQILNFMQWLLSLDENSLVVGYNLEYDLTAMYRNMYMFLHDCNEVPYGKVRPFRFQVLDLMICFDGQIAAKFGKKDAFKGGAVKPDFLFKNIPIVQITTESGKQTTSIEWFAQIIETEIKKLFGAYTRIKKTKHVCTRELEERKKHGITTTASGANCKFFTSLGFSIGVSKRLKDIIGLIMPNISPLELEGDVGWLNFDNKYCKKIQLPKVDGVKVKMPTFQECNYLISGEFSKVIHEEIREVWKHNTKIVKMSKRCRKHGKTNPFLTYAEHDIDFLLYVLASLDYPDTGFSHYEVLSQARLHFIGLPLELKNVDTRLKELKEAKALIQDEANKLLGYIVNFNSTKHKRELFAKISGQPIEAVKSVNKRTIASLLSSGKILPQYLTIAQKMCKTGGEQFLERQLLIVKACGRSGVHPTEMLNAATTYRKSSKGSLNTAGIQKDDVLRGAFRVFACGDQKGAEVTMLAASLGELMWMTNMIGTDPHANTTAKILGLELEKVVSNVARAKKNKDKRSLYLKLRNNEAKVVLFALFYGGTVEGISQRTGVAKESITRVLNALRAKYPRFSQFQESLEKFQNFQQMVKEGWHSLPKYVSCLATTVTNSAGVTAYGSVHKHTQIMLVKIMDSLCKKLDQYTCGIKVVRDSKSNRLQSVGNAFRSAMLGAISTAQGQVLRRLENFSIQSLVAFTTKYVKAFMYRHLGVALHDVHDEFLLPASERVDVKKFKMLFDLVVGEIKKTIPCFSWECNLVPYWEK